MHKFFDRFFNACRLAESKPIERGATYKFLMSGGHTVYAYHVASLSTRSNDDGSFRSYEIHWVEGHKPKFFSLSIPDIVAVVAA